MGNTSSSYKNETKSTTIVTIDRGQTSSLENFKENFMSILSNWSRLNLKNNSKLPKDIMDLLCEFASLLADFDVFPPNFHKDMKLRQSMEFLDFSTN